MSHKNTFCKYCYYYHYYFNNSYTHKNSIQGYTNFSDRKVLGSNSCEYDAETLNRARVYPMLCDFIRKNNHTITSDVRYFSVSSCIPFTDKLARKKRYHCYFFRLCII